MRLRLLGLPDLASDAVGEPGKTSEPSIRRDQIGRLRQAAALYGAAVRLLLGDLPKVDKRAAAVVAAAHFQDSSSPAELRKACGRFGDALGELFQAMPETIQQIAAENQDLSDPAKRAQQIRSLLAAGRLLYLVHSWDIDRMEFTSPSQLLRCAEFYDLFAWQQRRAAPRSPTRRRRKSPFSSTRRTLTAGPPPKSLYSRRPPSSGGPELKSKRPGNSTWRTSRSASSQSPSPIATIEKPTSGW